MKNIYMGYDSEIPFPNLLELYKELGLGHYIKHYADPFKIMKHTLSRKHTVYQKSVEELLNKEKWFYPVAINTNNVDEKRPETFFRTCLTDPKYNLWNTIDSRIKKEIIDEKCFLLLTEIGETFAQKNRKFINYFLDNHPEIPKHMVIYAECNMDVNFLEEEFHSIGFNSFEKMTIIYSEFIEKEDDPVTLDHYAHPLCFNHFGKLHRGIIASQLLKWGKFQNTSFRDPHIGDRNICDRPMSIDLFYEGINFMDDESISFIKSDYHDDIANLIEKLPVMIDMENMPPILITKNRGYMNRSLDTTFYRKSFLSMVTESTFFIDELKSLLKMPSLGGERSIFLTEKTYKCFVMKHPFLLASFPGSLSKLRELGYKTFSDFFDESYDDIELDYPRMQAILAELKRISDKPKEELLEIKKEMAPILDHNYNHLFRNEANSLDNAVCNYFEELL